MKGEKGKWETMALNTYSQPAIKGEKKKKAQKEKSTQKQLLRCTNAQNQEPSATLDIVRQFSSQLYTEVFHDHESSQELLGVLCSERRGIETARLFLIFHVCCSGMSRLEYSDTHFNAANERICNQQRTGNRWQRGVEIA
ncbi:hypothetical protein VTN00DRAFT_5781 [Thermoascus crustaceus]|uniref:uncharacterized protein n=1 Tax=Thermoascus crustaceus TaxID=5088 RepID=UPI003741F55A